MSLKYENVGLEEAAQILELFNLDLNNN